MSSSDPPVVSSDSSDSSRPVSFRPQTLVPALTVPQLRTKTTTPTTVRQHQFWDVDSKYVGEDDIYELSQDGKLLAVNRGDEEYVDIFKMNTEDSTFKFQPICRYQLEKKVKSLSFSPDNNYLAVREDNALTIFNEFKVNTTTEPEDSRCQRSTIRSENQEEYLIPEIITFSHDSKYIAVTKKNNTAVTICIRNKESTRTLVLRDDIHLKHRITTMHFSPVSESLAIGTEDGNIFIYNYTTGRLLHEIELDNVVMSIIKYSLHKIRQDSSVESVKYSNNGQFLAAVTDAMTLLVYNATTYERIQELQVLEEYDHLICHLAFSNSGNFIAISSNEQVLIYDFSADAIIYNIPIPSWANSLAYSANDEYLTIAYDNNVLTFDISFYKNGFFQLRDLNKNEITTYSPNGTYLVTYDKVDTNQGELKVFKTSTNNNKPSTIELYYRKKISSFIPDINFEHAVCSNDLKFLASFEHQKLIIYDFMKGSTWLSIDRDDDSSIPYHNYLPILVFSPDSKVLAIGSKDGLEVEFLELVAVIPEARNSLLGEWKPSPIYFPQTIHKISFAPMTLTENDKDNIQLTECSYRICITHKQGNDKYCVTTMNLHQHTVTPPEILLESDDTRICKLVKENKYSASTRNQEGKTIISLAAEKNKLSLVEKLIEHNPSLAFARNSNLKADNNETNGNNGNGIMTYLMSRYHLNSLSKVADGQFFNSSTSFTEVDQMNEVIMQLVQEQVNSSVIVKLLNVGEENCMDGFVIYSSIYVTAIKEPTKWWFWPSLLFKSLRRLLFKSLRREIQSQPQIREQEEVEEKVEGEEEQQQEAQRQKRRPLAELQKPRSSKTEWVHSAWQDLKIDDRKRVELKVLRVLLPNLASFESLTNFTNMSDNKPFGCQSLHAAIDANWSNWARKWFIGQLILYVVWLIAFTAFCMKTKQLHVGESTSIGGGGYGWLEYCLAGIAVLGVLCFFHVEIRQIKVLSKEHYLNDWWNIWQWIIMIFAISIVALRLIPGTSESLNGCISAMSLFCSWIGLLYHLRGFESCAWISIALYRIGKSLSAFILVLFVVIFSFSLALQALHDDSHGSSTDASAPSASPVEEPGSIFRSSLKTTLFASIMGEIDDDDFFKETYFDGLAHGILILLLVVVNIISLNALIAFISERFDRVLDEKNAVLKKQKAKVILDLYCLFSKDRRKEIEEENKWTSLVIPAADLGLEEEPSTLEKNVSRATKEDMKDMKKEIKEMKEVNVETKKEIKEDMKKEMTDMKKEIKDDMKDMMELQDAKMKAMMKVQDAKMNDIMNQIIATINASKQGSNSAGATNDRFDHLKTRLMPPPPFSNF